MLCPECKGVCRTYFPDSLCGNDIFMVCPICNGTGFISLLRALTPIVILIMLFSVFVFIMWLMNDLGDSV